MPQSNQIIAGTQFSEWIMARIWFITGLFMTGVNPKAAEENAVKLSWFERERLARSGRRLGAQRWRIYMANNGNLENATRWICRRGTFFQAWL
ncbi:MAG: hypothetical protein IPN96_12020 [Anaerolineales bacterium]|nr:hypothetical protein [Anaerolineales bacterium]